MKLCFIRTLALLFLGLFLMHPKLEATPIVNATGLASPTSTITFDTFVFSQGTMVDTQYLSLGVTFTQGLKYDTQGPTGFPGIDGHYIGNFTPLVTPYSIFFTESQSEVAFGFASLNQSTTLTAFLNGVTVETFTQVTNASTPATAFLGFTGIVFDEIEIAGSGLSLIDNIQTIGANNPVPEPATVALLGIGVVGLAGAEVRRRRKKKAVDKG